MLLRKNIFRVQLLIEKAFAPPFRRPFPEKVEDLEGQIIKFIPVGEINQKKSHSLLLLKLLHEGNLMLMNILKGKTVHCTLLCIEAHRDPLNHPDIVHRTLLLKIS